MNGVVEMVTETSAIAANDPLVAGPPLDDGAFADVRRRAILDGCKWDPQVGDVTTLARFPLLMRRATWEQLAHWAEQLTAEALAAEQEILGRPPLLDRLGLPRKVRRVLRRADELPPTPAAARVMRFDFHPTTEGWNISEVNSDVPGGFSEGSTFTQLIAEHFPSAQTTGSPIAEWTRSLLATAGERGVFALLSAPGFMEDHQVIAYLARQLQRLEHTALLARPEQILWRDGIASLDCDVYRGPVQSVVRFYQAEWLARLPRRCGWEHFFLGGRTPVGNPGIAALSESKRFPLVWDELRTPMSAWRRLLPETHDPREVDWAGDDGWLLKSAFCNNGDTVSVRAHLDTKKWRAVRRAVRWHARQWLAQRRFESVAIDTPLGAMHPCIGVYTFNGVAAGAYVRITPRPFVDYSAIDAALLLTD